jgi:hypothetical protein
MVRTWLGALVVACALYYGYRPPRYERPPAYDRKCYTDKSYRHDHDNRCDKVFDRYGR